MMRIVSLLAWLCPLFLCVNANAQSCNAASAANIEPFFNSNPSFQLEQIEVNLRINVMAEDDQSGNWPHSNAAEIASSKAEIIAIITQANYGLANLAQPLYWDANGVQTTGLPYTDDAKVEWLLHEDDIVFHDDSDRLTSMRGDRGGPRKYHDELGAKQETHINLFLYENANEVITGIGHGPFEFAANENVRPVIINMYSGFTSLGQSDYAGYKYVWSNNLNHELYHSLSGFGHTFEPEELAFFPELPSPDRAAWLSPSASNKEISNNLMGGSKQQDYLSPDQVKCLHNGIMSRVCRKYVANIGSLDPANYVYTITGNVLWDKVVRLNNDLDIAPGAQLKLQGCIKMGHDAVINVKNGAHLLFDGGAVVIGTLLSPGVAFGGALWGGIKVWGHKDKDQRKHPNHFGYISSTDNGGIIQGAYTAISTSKLDYGNVFDWSECGGGVIQLKHFTFENNQRDVQMLSYKTKNSLHYVLDDLSYFDDCHFLTSAELITLTFDDATNGKMPFYQPNVTLWDVHGVRFTRCQFVNSRTSAAWGPYEGYSNAEINKHLARIGLATFNAYVKVYGLSASNWDGPNPPYTGNHFYGLQTGILIRGTNGVAEGLYLKNKNSFENCGRAIKLETSSNDVVDNNEISWNMDYFNIFFESGTKASGYAVFDVAARGVFAQQNAVSSAIPLDIEGDDYGAGIRSLNHGVNSGGLYRFNSFSNCWPSVWFEKNLGQRITCNSFINIGYPNEPNSDLLLNQDYTSEIFAQGLCDPDLGWLPRNKFQENCNSIKDHMKINVQHIPNTGFDYFINPAEPAATQPQPSCTNHSFLRINPCTQVNLSTCGAISNGGNSGRSNGDYYQSVQEYQGYIDAAEAVMAAGNDPLVQSKLQDPLVANATLETDLAAMRPYLSDAVLILVIERQPAFAATYVKDLLIEHSPLSDAVLSSLESNALPQSEMDAIYAVQPTAYSLVHAKKAFLAAAYWERARNCAGYEQALRDTVLGDSLNLDSLLNFYAQLQGRGHLGVEINALIEVGNYTGAAAKLAALDLNDAEEEALYQYENLHLDLESSGRNWFQLTAAELLELETVFQSNTRAAGFAESILILIGEEPYPVDWPEAASQGSGTAGTGFDESNAGQNKGLGLYPNPSSGKLTIVLPAMGTGNPESLCRIYSLKGELVFEQTVNGIENVLNLGALPKGLYQVQVIGAQGILSDTFVKE